MNPIDNLNTKPVQQIINEVAERLSDESAWGRTNLGDRHGCLCLLGAVSVAEGIVTVADYIDYNERVREANYDSSVGSFEHQSAIYEALDKSAAVIALAKAIADVNPYLAEVYARDISKPSTVVYMFNDAKDVGFIHADNVHQRHELAYARVNELMQSVAK